MHDYDIVIDKSKILNILNKHPEMNDDLIKKIPDILENPTIILKSQSVEGRIIVFSEQKATDGKPVLIAMELNPSENKNNIEKIYKVASAYGRQNVKKMQDWLNIADNILYIDRRKNRTIRWLNGLGLQLPVPNNTNSSINSIPQSKEKGNTTTKYSIQKNKNNAGLESNSSSFSLPTKEEIISEIYKNVENRTSRDNQKNNKRINAFLEYKYPNLKITFTNFKHDGTIKIDTIETKENAQKQAKELQIENEKSRKKIERERAENLYKITPINKADEINIIRDKLPSLKKEFNTFEDIRNKTKKLVNKLKNQGYNLIYNESHSSADAMYIDILDDNDLIDTIRVANHYKAGSSGYHDVDIDMSEYKSKQALLKDIETEIDKVINRANNKKNKSIKLSKNKKLSQNKLGSWESFLERNKINKGTTTTLGELRLPEAKRNLPAVKEIQFQDSVNNARYISKEKEVKMILILIKNWNKKVHIFELNPKS